MVVLEGSDPEIYVSRLLPIFEGFGFSFGIFGLCKKSRFRKKSLGVGQNFGPLVQWRSWYVHVVLT